MGYRTPNIDRIAKEGSICTDYYGEQSCTAERSSLLLVSVLTEQDFIESVCRQLRKDFRLLM